MTPQAAARAAETARTAAAARAMPPWPWFPAANAALGAAFFTGVGSAQVIGWVHVAGKVTGLAGTACGIAFALTWVLLIAWWMRNGVIPLVAGAKPRSGLRDLWVTAGILAASEAAWAATGHLGWAAIVFGIAGGVHQWRRLLRIFAGPVPPATRP